MTGPVTRPSAQYGVHSEVGQLRKVLVCAPGLAHERLTPSNRESLLFDEVMWVQNARRDHLDFMTKMRDRGIDVVELHDLLRQHSRSPRRKDGCSTGRSCRTKWVWAWSRAPARSWSLWLLVRWRNT